jgi:hypothetical protein
MRIRRFKRLFKEFLGIEQKLTHHISPFNKVSWTLEIYDLNFVYSGLFHSLNEFCF